MTRTPGPTVDQGDLASLALDFDEEQAFEFIETLTSPRFGGRQSGSPEGEAAARYIAARFAEYGLQPAGTEGYLQPFEVPFAQVTEVPELGIVGPDGAVDEGLGFRADYNYYWGGYAGGGVGDGQVYWVAEGDAEDYRDLDVEGEIVLVRPDDVDEALRQAVEHRVDGVLMLTESEWAIEIRRTYRTPPYLPESVPTLWVSSDVAARLLSGSGHTVDDLTLLFEPRRLETAAYIKVTMHEPGEATAYNVLGVLSGRDSQYRDEVVIVGAHLDHLGTDADGALYPGANDDASGVAVLLEVARLWQTHGYVPERTVLFAAFDAEEKGLLGSRHYVEHPRYPLTQTIGMVQLDMVGLATAGVLTVDGYETSVGQQVQASADLFGVETEPSLRSGGSDHAPFARADVPAVLLTWDSTRVPYYHTPEDTLETLQPERLRQVGAITAHTLMSLATTAPQLEVVVNRQAEAIRRGDTAALEATLTGEAQQWGAAWLVSRPREQVEGYTSTINALQIRDRRARANLTARHADQDGRSRILASYPVEFARTDSAWRVLGPVTRPISATYLSGQVVAGIGESDEGWIDAVDGACGGVGEALGLPRDVLPLSVTVYASQDTRNWLGGAGSGPDILHGESITETAISVLLQRWGLPRDQGQWLRVGLVEYLEKRPTTDGATSIPPLWLPALTGTERARDLLLPSKGEPPRVSPALAGMLVDLLLERYGGEGLTAICAAWGRTGDQDAALAAVGLDGEALAAAWEDTYLEPAISARQALEDLLAAQADAVTREHEGAVLQVVRSDTDEGRRVEASRPAVADCRLEGRLVALASDRAEAVVDAHIALEDRSLLRPQFRVRLVYGEGGWHWDGIAWEMVETEHWRIAYQRVPVDLDAVEATADAVYRQVTADLGASPGTLTLRLYQDVPNLRLLGRSGLLPWGEAVPPPEGALELPWSDVTSLRRDLARLLTRRILNEQGVTLAWLQEGIALHEASRVDPALAAAMRMRFVPRLDEAQRFERLYRWEAMPPPHNLSESEAEVWGAMAWSFVNCVVEEHGLPGLQVLVTRLGRGDSLDAALEHATGESLASWDARWQAAVRTGGVPEEWIVAAQTVDVGRIRRDVSHMASEAYRGRLAGSAGALAVADWVAGEMAAADLEPGAPDGTFFQRVAVSYTMQIALPLLRFEAPAGAESLSLPYPEGFDLPTGCGGPGVTAQVAWLPQGFGTGLRLGGRVALMRKQVSAAEAARLADQHGASAVILVERYRARPARRLPSTVTLTDTVPVAVIDEEAFGRVLDLAGISVRDAQQAPPALLLPLDAQLTGPCTLQRVEARNVVGVMPGRQPDAAPLVVIAHYDGVGALPDGRVYPGANKNASGVAVMLEMARAWHAVGHQPERTVYFCALGAEEADLRSSQVWLEAMAGQDVAGVLVLDTLGAAGSYYLTIDAVQEAEDVLAFDLLLAGQLLDRRVSEGRYSGRNTHQVLRQAEWPTLLLYWPDGEGVHTLADTPEALDPLQLRTSAEVLTLGAMLLADE